MSDTIDKGSGSAGAGGEDTVYTRKRYQCPQCKEILQESYFEQNPFPEIPCMSCGSLLSRDTIQEIELHAPNQRSEPRCPASLKVSYRSYDEFIHEYTKNVSRQGMFIKTRRNHQVRDRVDLSLQVPGLPDPVHIVGEVVRVCLHSASDEDAGIGIKFIDIDEKSRQALIAFIASHKSCS